MRGNNRFPRAVWSDRWVTIHQVVSDRLRAKEEQMRRKAKQHPWRRGEYGFNRGPSRE